MAEASCASGETKSASCSTIESKPKRKNFKWTGKMVEDLINSIDLYKSSMEYKNLDFDADKTAQYAWLREQMAEIYKEENESFFGPVKAPTLPQNINELTKEEQKEAKKLFKKQDELYKKGKNRVQEKTKEIRQGFSKAIISGSRSGSGKLVYEHYDSLVKIWGGSATCQPLPFGISSSSNTFEEEMDDDDGGDSFTSDDSEISDCNYDENHPEKNLPLFVFREDKDSSKQEDGKEDDEASSSKNLSQKRKLVDKSNDESTAVKKKSVVPKLIDNKRKHLEKTLSASQRDQLLMKDIKGDAEFRQNLVQVMRESNESFSNSIKEISKAMSDLSKGMCSSMELLANSLRQPNAPQQLPHQNIYYQQYQQPNPGVGNNGYSNSQPNGYFSQMLNNNEQL